MRMYFCLAKQTRTHQIQHASGVLGNGQGPIATLRIARLTQGQFGNQVLLPPPNKKDSNPSNPAFLTDSFCSN